MGKTSKPSLFITLASIAALLLMIVYVHLNPKISAEPVATIVDSINAEWADSSQAIKPGTQLLTRQGMMQLKKGVLKIAFNDGSEAVIEAPSEFELITYDQIDLRYGRVYTKVPKGVVGFIIGTPNSKVIDLGTEFGVQVNVDGVSEVHVMKGKVSLVSGARSSESKSQLVYQGYAKRVRNNSELVEDIKIAENAFVQDINSQKNCIWRGQAIDLSDVIGGGNGFGTGKKGLAIDVESGTLTNNLIASGISRTKPYTITDQLTYIDGVFIPDGEYGPVQVSSEGDTFSNCPDTQGRTFYGPYNGSVLPLKTENEVFDHPVQIGGQKYGTAQHPIIFLHSNLGVTFDLEKIRQSLPQGIFIKNFSSYCAVGEGPEQSKRPHDYVDFYVLVDGQERFRLTDVEYQSGLKSIEVPLTENDRFLTLMTTNGNDGSVHLDWSFFDEPKLNVSKIDSN